jgi:hypothetical protein
LKIINTLENTFTIENLYEKSHLFYISKATILKIPQKQGNKEGCLRGDRTADNYTQDGNERRERHERRAVRTALRAILGDCLAGSRSHRGGRYIPLGRQCLSR